MNRRGALGLALVLAALLVSLVPLRGPLGGTQSASAASETGSRSAKCAVLGPFFPSTCPPVLHDDHYVTGVDTVLTVPTPGVLVNDELTGGRIISFGPSTGDETRLLPTNDRGRSAQGGVVQFDTRGGFRYTPPRGFSGLDSFVYKASGKEGTGTATVTIAVGSAAVANDDSYTALKNTTLQINAPGVLSNDSGFPDPTATPITNGSTTQGGTVTLNADGSFAYTPPANFTGDDSFTYTASNALGSDPATVTITVQEPAAAIDDSYTTPKNTALNVPAPGVLANDTGFPAPTATPITNGSTTQGGTVTLNADGSFDYTPKADFTGDDTFTYTATNAAGSDTATVTIAVTAPAVANNDSYSTPKNTALNISAPGVLSNDTGFPVPAATPITNGTTAEGGTVTLNADGSFDYTPKTEFTGNDSFTYTASNTFASDTATVTIEVTEPAVAADDHYDVLKDTVLNVPAPGVLSNDTGFPAPTAALIGGNTTPAGGTVSLNSDGSFTYTPPTGYSGPDNFAYSATNSTGSSSAIVYIAVQTPAVAIDDSYSTPKNTTLNIPKAGVLTNDSGYPDPTAVPISSGTTTQGGTVTLNADGSFDYTPPADFTGDDSFTYTATNAAGSDTATVTISVQTPAVAVADSYTALKNTTLNVAAPGVLANDTGFPDPTAVPITNEPTQMGGTVTLNADGSFSYTPPTDFTGLDSFIYRATNAAGSNTATVTINVQAPAVAHNDSYTGLKNAALNVPAPGVLANDTGVPAPTAVPITNGATTEGGTVTLNADGSFDYTPPADFTGDDTFTYSATNAQSSSNATVTITVQAPPVAANDSYAVLKNAELDVSAPGVLANDTGFPAPTATPITNGATAQGGTVTLNADGSFKYTPKADFTGNDTFTYTATNAAGTDTATVTISVQTPAVANDDSYSTTKNAPLTFSAPGVLSNDTGFPAPSATPINAGTTTQGGTVTLNADGSFTYTPPADFTGNDTFTYAAVNEAGSDTATVTISVQTPPVATNDSYSTLKNTALNVSAPGVLANDTGVPAPTATPISNGATTQGGTVTLNADGSFSYTPKTDFTGNDTFTYTATNAAGSDTATVTIAVQAPPVATDDSYTTSKDAALTVPAASGVLANDTGFPAPTATPISNGATTQGGTVTLNADGSFTYTPKAGFNGNDTFTYTATNAAGSDTGTVTIMVQIPAPVVTNDTYPQTVIGNVSINSASIPFSVTSNDTYTGTVTITASDATSAKGGTVSMTTSGTGIGQFTYNPPAGYEGADSFTYTLTNAGGSSTGTVNLTVSGMVWFINNNATSAGDGRLSSPFNMLSSFNAVNNGTGNNPAAGDNIFLYESGTSYTGTVTLLGNQRLIGQDATAGLSTITGLTPPSGSASFPAMNATNGTKVTITSSGNGINLSQNNLVQGLTVGNTTGTGITGSNFGTATIKDTSVNNGSGAALSFSTGTLDATLTSVSAKNATNGILLSSTSGSFSVTGDGSTAGSGGTIQSITNRGASFTNASNVSLKYMNFTNADTTNGSGCTTLDSSVDANTNINCNAAIYLKDVTTVTLDHLTINGSEQAGINGNNVTGFTLSNSEVTNAGTKTQSGSIVPESGVQFVNLLGTASITGSNIHDNAVSNLAVHNNTGTLTSLTISNTTFSMTGNGTTTNNAGGAGIDFSGQSTANLSLSLKNSTVTKNAKDGFFTLAAGTAKVTLDIETNSITNNQSAVRINAQDTTTTKFTINNNTPITGHPLTAISINLLTTTSGTAGALTGTVSGNTIGTTGVAGSGSGGDGIAVDTYADSATGTHNGIVTVAITNNSINGIGGSGISLTNGNGNPTMNATVTGNSIDLHDPVNSFASLYASSGKGLTDTSNLCVDFKSNTMTNTAGVTGIRARQQGTGSFRMPGYSGSGTDDTAVQNFLIGQNTVNGSDALATHTSATGFSGGGACTMP